MSLHSRKWGHHDLQMLRFGELASTVTVRTHGDFGSIPSPYDVDPEWKLRSKRAVKAYERSERESLVRKLLLKLESIATRYEAHLPYD